MPEEPSTSAKTLVASNAPQLYCIGRSLNNNQLCGLYVENRRLKGTYTAEGITKIAEMLKTNTTLTSIRCRVPCLPYLPCYQPLALSA